MKKAMKAIKNGNPGKTELDVEALNSISGGTYEEAEEYLRFLLEKYELDDEAELVKVITPEEKLFWKALRRHHAGKPFISPPGI